MLSKKCPKDSIPAGVRTLTGFYASMAAALGDERREMITRY
jgi:hypothetical protein